MLTSPMKNMSWLTLSSSIEVEQNFHTLNSRELFFYVCMCVCIGPDSCQLTETS